MLRIALQTIAQFGHIGVHGAIAAIGFVRRAPDGSLQLLARKGSARISGEDQQQLELSRRELDIAATATWLAQFDLVFGQVQGDVANAHAAVAIGEGRMTASPLQLAAAYASLANDGFYVAPTLIAVFMAQVCPNA